MADTEVYEVETQAEAFGEKVQCSKLTVWAGVNGYAQAHIYFPPPDAPDASKEAKAITSADVASRMGQMQQKAFAARSTADSSVHVKVTGGTGGVNIKLKGYGQAPEYTFSPQTVNVGASILDEMAAIDVARFGIYGSTYQDQNVRAFNTYGKTLKDCGWSIPDCLYSMAEDMVKNADKSVAFSGKNLTSLDKQTKYAQHNLNKQVLPLLKKLCENSKQFGWKDTLNGLKSAGLKSSVDTEIRRCLCGHLVSSSGSFLTALLGICEDFQCVLVCATSSDGMEYEMRSKQYVMASPEPLTIPIRDLNAQAAGGAGIFPTRFVAVTREGPVDTNVTTTTQFMAFPEGNMKQGGTALPVSPPSWMNGIHADAAKAKDSGEPAQRSGCQKTSGGEIQQATDEQCKATNEDSESIMKEWAKCCYLWNALGTSQALINAPMIVEVVPGKRYQVKNVNGDTLFTGFASSVEYSLQTGSGSSNSATTFVTFTHVEFGSFSLPTD